MRALLSWLAELTPLPMDPSDRHSVAELASELDALGLVVERVEEVGQGFAEVVLAQVLEIASIEGADRIRRVVVDRGAGEMVEVVCGAWNFGVGDVVALAPVGAVLPGDFRIDRRKMKGVVSSGMLCSGRELGLTDDHAGILVLGSAGDGSSGAGGPGTPELGQSLADHLGYGLDVVYHLDVEPNRPDCLSMLGIARDLAARYGLPLTAPAPSLAGLAGPGPAASELVKIEIEDGELCSRFAAGVMTGIVAVPSPPLVQRRLLLSGMRPIGHVVDASNYVMLELGQPSHPYDLERLGGGGFRVRAARPGERLHTLDGEERVLGTRDPREDDARTALDIVICDADDLPIGVAGVMGGQSSEISEATTTMVLEVARFHAVSVGRTARHLGLRSEASIRFERGTDAEGIERAAARVFELVADAATKAGVPAPQVAPGLADASPRPYVRPRLRLRVERANRLIGLELDAGAVAGLLGPVGYEVVGQGGDEAAGDHLDLLVPSWRPDVQQEVDLIEDVARAFGYRNIPSSERRSPYVGALGETQLLRRRLRRILAGLGAHEAWTSSLTEPAVQEAAGAGAAAGFLRLANPMVAEESVLRGGLLAGLLASARHNASHRNPLLRLFEIGDVFALGHDGRPVERERVGLLLAFEGDDAQAAVGAWRVIEEALGLIGIRLDQSGPPVDGAAGPTDGIATMPPQLTGLHPARSGRILALADGADGPMTLGVLGEVDPAVLDAFGLAGRRVGWVELDLDALAGAPRRSELAQEVSRFPSSDVDLALVVSNEVPAGDVQAELRRAAGDLCESLWLFDVYRGSGTAEGSRSLAFRLRLCAPDRTLTDAELTEVRSHCIAAVESAFGARLRA